ncbi:MAG TPA: universal stress protein [Tangfeifania sp.]|nr:universal stress protein [Tangfeifania sp.]
MKTNLLILDTYNNVEDFLAYAFSFSKYTKRKLEIKYVFDFNWMVESYNVGPGGPVDPALVAAEKNVQNEFEVAEKKLNDLVGDYLKKHPAEVPYNISVSAINRIDVVQEQFEKNPDMMLLISNQQSYSEASGGLIGYPNLIEHVKCPVLVIPQNTPQFVMQNVVYATDYHQEDIESLTHLSSLHDQPESMKVTFLHNQEEIDFTEKLKWAGFQKLVSDESAINNPGFELMSKKETLEAIEEFVDKKAPDLLIILKEKRGFFKQIFSSGETKGVLTHLNIPVLVYHEK